MQFTHFEINIKQLNKMLNRTDKLARMINPDEVVEGRQYLNAVLCKACNMIPSKLNIKECSKCKSIICDKCMCHAKSKVDDAMFDTEQNCPFD